jgi:enolase
MQLNSLPQEIRSISCRRILNSHVRITNEFTIGLRNGSIGTGSPPEGETTSIYEDRSTGLLTDAILDELCHGEVMEKPFSQIDFDQFLQTRMGTYGRNNCWALSLAFFNAVNSPLSNLWFAHREVKAFPRLCLNALNGGYHAYTNPVLSDFPEYLLVPKFDNVQKVLVDYANVQNEIKENLVQLKQAIVNNNPVFRLGSADNRECISFLQDVLARLGLSRDYDVRIDASAGDLRAEGGYKFALTDRTVKSTDQLQRYWSQLIEEYGIGFLEDPFGERDYEGWRMLANEQSTCKLIGDNLYSSDPARIEQGARNGYSHGVIIKPNQA